MRVRAVALGGVFGLGEQGTGGRIFFAVVAYRRHREGRAVGACPDYIGFAEPFEHLLRGQRLDVAVRVGEESAVEVDAEHLVAASFECFSDGTSAAE